MLRWSMVCGPVATVTEGQHGLDSSSGSKNPAAFTTLVPSGTNISFVAHSNCQLTPNWMRGDVWFEDHAVSEGHTLSTHFPQHPKKNHRQTSLFATNKGLNGV